MRLHPSKILLALLLSTATAAAEPALVIKAARLFDGKGDRAQSPGLVVVQGEKIVGVGPGAAIPAGARVIDLGDATILPGLIDAHTHLTGEASDDYEKDLLDGLRTPVPEQALRSSVWARRTVEAGFTTVRDLGSYALLDVGLRDAIAKGWVVGPRMLVSVNAIGATGGHCDSTGGFRPGFSADGIPQGPETGVVDGPDAIRAAVRFNVKHGADVIKTCATGGVLSLADTVGGPQLSQEELNVLVETAHSLHKKVAAHAHGAEGAKRAILAGVDSIEHGSLLDDQAWSMMKQRGTVLVMTPIPCHHDPKRRAGFPPVILAKVLAVDAQYSKNMKRAIALGVTIGFGTDAAVCPHGTNADSLVSFVELGMSPVQALRAATSVDAKLLGVDDKLGTLERGKLADVVAVGGDALADVKRVHDVRLVVKGGAIVKQAAGR